LENLPAGAGHGEIGHDTSVINNTCALPNNDKYADVSAMRARGMAAKETRLGISDEEIQRGAKQKPAGFLCD